jgi:hypothetical protein
MKYLLFALTVVSMNAGAAVINFKCDFTGVTTTNQFSLEASSVEEVGGKFHNVSFDLNLRHAGRESRDERFAVTRDGSVKYVEAGTISTKRLIQLSSPVKGADLENINLIIDATRPLTSHIRFLNGKTFVGTCTSL